jgi:Uma2 family endonuclease
LQKQAAVFGAGNYQLLCHNRGKRSRGDLTYRICANPEIETGKHIQYIYGKDTLMALAQEKIYYTYADFLEWDENEHFEIIDGEAVMLGAPDRVHQEISGEIFYQIKHFLRGKTCKVYDAPFSVRLNPAEDNSDDTVLEPDIVVVCDPAKLDKKGCTGAPDLVIEILSPTTARHDKVVKFNKYQHAGVREYWIVDPDTKTIQVCVLENGRYILSSYDEDTGTVPVSALPGCGIDLRAVFAD